MEAMDRKMPSSIDYTDVLPLSVPAESRRRKFFPTNGGSFNAVGSNEIRIPISSTNALLDTEHSYLDFTISNNNPAGVAGVGFSIDSGGAAMFFSRLRIEQQGQVLSDTQEYNRLVASVINPVSETGGGRLSATLKDYTMGGNIGNGAAAPQVNIVPSIVANRRGDRLALCNHGAVAANGRLAPGQSLRFSMPLITGLFTQDKLIPLPLVDKNNPITIVLTIDAVENYGLYSALPAPDSMPITQISYNAQLIEVGPDVINQFVAMRDMMGGQLALSGHDWEHNSTGLTGGAAGGGGERIVNVPMRKRSVKSLFWVGLSDTLANAGPLAGFHLCYNKSFGGSLNMDSYQLKAGSVVYPPTPIQGPGDAGAAASQHRRGECLQELCKAMGTLGFAAPSGRTLNTMTYVGDEVSSAGIASTATGDLGAGGLALVGVSNAPCFSSAFGIDLESFQHTAIESGLDTETMALQTNLIINTGGVATIGAENKIVHTWICYDKHYYFNSDGSITFSD